MRASKYSASAVIAATPADVVRAVCDVANIHQWNPALSPVRTATPGATALAVTDAEYTTRIRGIFRARLRYVEVAETRVTYELSALGSVEQGSWEAIRTSQAAVLVTHRIAHRGFLLRLMRPAFESVADWRLARLREVLPSRATR